MADENVRVAVRVRPFNQREKDANSKLCVAMTGNQTTITNPKDAKDEKKFAFDFSYWSHDGFKDVSGYSTADGPKYADQKKVFSDLGVGVLSNAWNGFNATLFAYGQTGAGKSYSVVGYGANKGIVPMVCEDIFNKKATMKDAQVEVTFSMLEIYSEHVRDLLNSKTHKESLVIREDPKLGFYPQGLLKVTVGSYADIDKLMDEGSANRTVAATKMNATSSRGHTIVIVNILQKRKNEAGQEIAKSAYINLVDLAGSERAESTGATGERLKEGASINLSLTSLGAVIAALSEASSGKNVRIPYRDSVLTKLLMNALGGNSKTIMIAAISPADINFDETLSTLRFADRAKQIKTKATVNEDPTEKLIKDLQDENTKLKAMLASGKADPTLIASLSNHSPNASDIDIIKHQLEENEKQMKALEQSHEEKLAHTQTLTSNLESSKLTEKAKKTAHFSNVSPDPSSTGKLKLLIEGEGVKKIGSNEKSDILIKGLGICDEHAIMEVQKGKFTIKQGVPDAKIVRNGIAVATLPVEIAHLDRILFGASQFFQFIDPSKATPKDVPFTYEMFQDEVAKGNGLVLSSDRAAMTPEQIQAQNELVDLLPAIEEANMISIKLDKKVRFAALPVNAEARGDYDSKIKAYVSMKNFELGLEWIWTKEKFLNRKADMTDMMHLAAGEGSAGLKDKFKNYDPFAESPDTPTQIGTIHFNPMSIAYMHPFKTDTHVIDLKGRESGSISIEFIPCNVKGQPITDKDSIAVHDPKIELLNKPFSFLVKINNSKPLGSVYEDIFCQYSLMNDPTVYKTDVIKGTNAPNFKYSKQFTFVLTPEVIDFILNKSFYIQVWGEQKHPNMHHIKKGISTKEYFDREGANDPDKLVKSSAFKKKTVDPRIQKLTDELNLLKMKDTRNATIIANINKLIGSSDHPISVESIKAVMAANDEKTVKKHITEHVKNKGKNLSHHDEKEQEAGKGSANEAGKSKTCTIL